MNLAEHVLRSSQSAAPHTEGAARDLAAESLAELLGSAEVESIRAQLRPQEGSSDQMRRFEAEIGGMRWLVAVSTPVGTDAVEIERFYLGGRYCDWLGRDSRPMLTRKDHRYCSNTHHLARRLAEEDSQAAGAANWATALITTLACLAVILIAATAGPLFGGISLVLFAAIVAALIRKTSGRKPRELPVWGPASPLDEPQSSAVKPS